MIQMHRDGIKLMLSRKPTISTTREGDHGQGGQQNRHPQLTLYFGCVRAPVDWRIELEAGLAVGRVGIS
jgi:hypothetical protein